MLLRVQELQCSVRRRKDTILRTCRGITRGWTWTIRPTIDTEYPYCNLGGWTVFTVTALVALASFLCVFCCVPSHRGFDISSKGWRVWEEVACAEMTRCNCTKPINARGCQGMNRTSLHTANQCTAQLNYMFLFPSGLWSYFCFLKLPRDQWLVHNMLYLCGLQYYRYLAI